MIEQGCRTVLFSELLLFIGGKPIWVFVHLHQIVMGGQKPATVRAPVTRLLREAESYEEALAALPEVITDMDDRALVEELVKAAFLARAAGDNEGDNTGDNEGESE